MGLFYYQQSQNQMIIFSRNDTTFGMQASFRKNSFVVGITFYSVGHHLRPVICLKSGAKIKTNWMGSEEYPFVFEIDSFTSGLSLPKPQRPDQRVKVLWKEFIIKFLNFLFKFSNFSDLY